jgi:hypothetical protein
MRTMFSKKLSLGWLIVFLMPVAAQQIDLAKLPETLAGQRVAAVRCVADQFRVVEEQT